MDEKFLVQLPEQVNASTFLPVVRAIGTLYQLPEHENVTDESKKGAMRSINAIAMLSQWCQLHITQHEKMGRIIWMC